ncbi:tyrosine-type recombinase/integrase [uncultured Roseobacter sp.]|uniref:tyrosine-type recombinase/integrase n=1 Tax=uncultured Roseobacter sp. TaxID=114847 RepID=UPI003451A598
MATNWCDERPSGAIIEDLMAWLEAVDLLDNPIHRVFYEWLLFTGLRKSEAFNMEWKDVHEDHIHLPMTKNGRSFDLPILQTHHEILAPLRGLSRTWVFPSPKSMVGYITNPLRIPWRLLIR